MPDQFYLDYAKYWRKRAKEVRALAEQVGNFETRSDILEIADDYEQLAESTEERAWRKAL
jgi:hypothetical protein